MRAETEGGREGTGGERPTAVCWRSTVPGKSPLPCEHIGAGERILFFVYF